MSLISKLLMKLIPEKLLFGYLSKGVRAVLAFAVAKLIALGAAQVPGLSEFLSNPELSKYLEGALTGMVYPLITWLKRKMVKNGK